MDKAIEEKNKDISHVTPRVLKAIVILKVRDGMMVLILFSVNNLKSTNNADSKLLF